MGSWDNGVWEWEFKWGRELSSRNLESFNGLLIFLNRNKSKQNGEDRWIWKHSSNGVYTVNKAYNMLLSKHASLDRSCYKEAAYKKLWKSWAIRKASITAWKLIKERMATVDNLERRGVNFNPSEKICQLCKEEEENTRHIFFKCKVAFSIWSKVINWLGVSMVLHEVPTIHFLQFSEGLGKGNRAKVAATLWIGIIWNIWILRNNVVFEKALINLEREVTKIKISVWNWISAKDRRLLLVRNEYWEMVR
ncbi:hypothetical protein ACS0TY_015205 [Phlomoides rotata]